MAVASKTKATSKTVVKQKKEAVSKTTKTVKTKQTTKVTKTKTEPQAYKSNKKVVLLTGATSGMGLEILKDLALKPYVVLAVGRDPSACKAAMDSIDKKEQKANIMFCLADLSVMSQVNNLAQDINQKLNKLNLKHIDVIYFNAAQFTPEISHTYERHEVQWATNYLSVVLLTDLLMPNLKLSTGARIITVTNKPSNNQKLDFQEIQNAKNPIKMYNYSKLACLMFAMQFNEEYKDTNICAYSVYPGFVNSRLGALQTKGIKGFFAKLRLKKATNVIDAIQTSLYLICAPHLPAKVVLYYNYRPIMPPSYALSPFNRQRLWRATRSILGLSVK